GALGPSGERCRRCETVLKGILGLRSYGGLAPLITASEEKRRGHLLALMRRLDDRAACEIENLADASKEKGGAS
ncbi:MAG: hypothetical protein WCG06_05715, partial [Candidatus Omnitrophota bacterium]